jgi:hypothetical protein
MASDEAIKLANEFKLIPQFIFRESSLNTSMRDMFALLKIRTCNVFELYNTMQRCHDFGLRLELEIEAYEYWMVDNKELVERWDRGDKTGLMFGNIDFAREAKINAEKILNGVKSIFEELKQTRIRFG